MKKLLLLFVLVITSCSGDDISKETQCNCTVSGIRYISYDAGLSWHYNSTDQRTGIKMPCWYDDLETGQIYGEDGVWYKTVWICLD